MATWSELKARVKAELDLEDEDFIDDTDLLYYANRAVNSAENLILTLNEDYFLDKTPLTLINGSAQYDLPTGIYAHKLRRLIYVNGSTKYVIKRIKNLAQTVSTCRGDYYKYVATNNTTSGVKINIYPTPAESGAYVTVWFLRNANTITQDSDVIDLPEAYDYVAQYMIDMCVNKERGTPDSPPSPALREQERLLVEALTNRFPDDDNTVEPDVSFYYEVN